MQISRASLPSMQQSSSNAAEEQPQAGLHLSSGIAASQHNCAYEQATWDALSSLPCQSWVQRPIPYIRDGHWTSLILLCTVWLIRWQAHPEVLAHKHARKDQNVLIVLRLVIVRSCSVAVKPKGPAESPDTGRRHRDRQLPCKVADALRLNTLKPSTFSVFIPAPTTAASRGVSEGSRLEANRQPAINHPPAPQDRWVYTSPASLQTQQLLQARSETRKNSKAKRRGQKKPPQSRQESLKRSGWTQGG